MEHWGNKMAQGGSCKVGCSRFGQHALSKYKKIAEVV